MTDLTPGRHERRGRHEASIRNPLAVSVSIPCTHNQRSPHRYWSFGRGLQECGGALTIIYRR